MSRILLILSFLVLISSCQKDSDEEEPTITIITPNGGSYDFGDTILVRVQVSDNVEVTRVSTRLLKDGLTIEGPESQVVNSQSALVSFALIIDNPQLETGSHSLNIRATDGSNDENVFVTVFVNELALKFEGLVGISQTGANTTVTRFDSILASSTLINLPMDHTVSAVNSFRQFALLGGGVSGDLSAIDLINGSANWSYPNLNIGTLPYFLDANFDAENRTMFVCDEDGLIRGINSDGVVTVTTQCVVSHRPLRSWVLDGRLVVLEKNRTSNNYQLGAYFRQSGAPEITFPSDMDVIQAYSRQGSDALLFGNRNGDGVLRTYSTSFGPGFELRDLPGIEIIDVIQFSGLQYLLATTAGFYTYSYTPNDLLPFGSSVSIIDMEYDLLTGAIYFVNSSGVFAMDPSNGNTTQIGTLSGTPKRIHVVYNK